MTITNIDIIKMLIEQGDDAAKPEKNTSLKPNITLAWNGQIGEFVLKGLGDEPESATDAEVIANPVGIFAQFYRWKDKKLVDVKYYNVADKSSTHYTIDALNERDGVVIDPKVDKRDNPDSGWSEERLIQVWVKAEAYTGPATMVLSTSKQQWALYNDIKTGVISQSLKMTPPVEKAAGSLRSVKFKLAKSIKTTNGKTISSPLIKSQTVLGSAADTPKYAPVAFKRASEDATA